MKTWMLYDGERSMVLVLWKPDGERVDGISTVEADSKTDALNRMCEALNNDSEVLIIWLLVKKFTSTKVRFMMAMILLEYMM